MEKNLLAREVAMKTKSCHAAFIDRDGVLTKTFGNRPANVVEEIELLPGVPEGVRELREAGLLLVVVSNQGGIALGHMTEETMLLMNARVNELLVAAKAPPIDHFYWCAHAPNDGCICRKPSPGMLFDATRDHGIDLRRSYMVGDEVRDMDCAVRAGVPTRYVVVSDRYQDTPMATAVFATFQQAAHVIALKEMAR